MKKMISLITCMLVLVLSLTACSQAAPPPDSGASLSNGGILVLSVNPKIAVEYDDAGLVTGIIARNEDALAIIAGCEGMIGKSTRDVVSDLVTRIGEAGYFVDEVDGSRRQIVLEIEPGSALPSDTFLDDVIADVRSSIDNHDWTTPLVIEGVTDYANTDYGPDNDGITDFGKTDYTAKPIQPAPTEPVKPGNTNYGKTDYNDTDYGPNNDGVTDYGKSDYGTKPTEPSKPSEPTEPASTEPVKPGNTDYGKTDYNDTDYGPNNDGVTDYGKSDYGTKPTEPSKPSEPTEPAPTEPVKPGNTDYGKTDYNDTDYGPNNDGVTDYNDTDYGPNNDGVTDYHDGKSDYHDGKSDYDNGKSDYKDGKSDYDD